MKILTKASALFIEGVLIYSDTLHNPSSQEDANIYFLGGKYSTALKDLTKPRCKHRWQEDDLSVFF